MPVGGVAAAFRPLALASLPVAVARFAPFTRRRPVLLPGGGLPDATATPPYPAAPVPPGRLPGDRRLLASRPTVPTPCPPHYPAIPPRQGHPPGHRTPRRLGRPPDGETRLRGPRPLQARHASGPAASAGGITTRPWRLPRITPPLHTHRPPDDCELASPIRPVDSVTPGVTAGYPEVVGGTWNDCLASQLAIDDATNPHPGDPTQRCQDARHPLAR